LLNRIEDAITASFFKEFCWGRCIILLGGKMIEKVSYMSSPKAIVAVDDLCHRCLGQTLRVAENNHIYCEECSKNRRMSDHLFLKRYQRKRKYKHYQLDIPFELSKQQIKGQVFIQDCYDSKNHGFLHAVCGAGKTEMTLQTIYEGLRKRKSIVFVIPRVEVIKELVKRFQSYFKHTHICGLYHDQLMDESADIFISTPQQLVKFYREFDLMLIDEADAFPFYQNEYLYRLVEKALKPDGVKIYISATLPKDYQKKIDQEGLAYCLIPRRFHMNDLVIPSFEKYTYLFSDDILKAIQTYGLTEKRLMIYFPSIHLMSRYRYFLFKKGIDCKMISSKTRFKNAVLKAFTHHQFSVLLTTTILERGVTYPNCDAYVLQADHPVFNRETLIQIAGRVGRDKTYVHGRLVFFSRFITGAMDAAKQSMLKMNQVTCGDM